MRRLNKIVPKVNLGNSINNSPFSWKKNPLQSVSYMLYSSYVNLDFHLNEYYTKYLQESSKIRSRIDLCKEHKIKFIK